ncbi:cAMP-dependent protein kinase inhibitor beta isoform X1 [Polypterus senegalus]|uniref:cAMP-dependent protein kinase inhibitor beta isoform X1 n=1 Tax=Polypterus senegalus TaxID=55291 RepID=UPI0019654D6D|nr:cAMP-dependent protein kinase inhibitor beta isoform X1 [Polypterus senegalus]XP_039604347.1 cAMP-dependent protein kinase inhibitor beta isoform X1 [Polypterus senegalus]XP_039604348.1 cAMP-dependent protein kinase inhibitor beta isoform X1 [Polypterus senegalus]
MTDVEPVVTDFAASGRTGRRNALPDILGSPAGVGTSELPHKLAELSVKEHKVERPLQTQHRIPSLKNRMKEHNICLLLGNVPVRSHDLTTVDFYSRPSM